MVHFAHGSTVITFDVPSSGSFIRNGYGGLIWSNFYVFNGALQPPSNGYHNGTVSPPNITLNAGGSPASFSSASLLDVSSAYMAAAFVSGLQVRVQGFSGTNLLYDNTYVVSTNAPTLVNFNYLQVDNVYFVATPASQFVLDNLTISTTNPVANFATVPNTGRAPLTVQFVDQSLESMTNWDWDFGDGSLHGTLQNPSHTYSNDAIYSVTLVATTTDGLTSTNTGSISATPVASFSALPYSGEGPLTVQFSDQSRGSVTNWGWYFGDGVQSNDRNPSHIYTSLGNFDVTLIVTDNSGLTDRTNGTITVSPIPNFAANPTSGRLPLTVQFTDQSTGTFTKWDWDFGDGTAHSSAQNPTHTYTTDAVYSVTLVATSSRGLTGTNTGAVSVTPVGSFAVAPDASTGPMTVQFTDQSKGSITNWAWNFGDFVSSTAQNPSHTYTRSGTYDVVLVVRDDSGLTDRTNANATISPLFTANPAAGFVPLSVQFNYQSSASVTNWDWDFGDGSAHSSVKNPSHTYNTNGDFLVVLTVTTTNGLASTDRGDVVVAPPPVCSTPPSLPLLPGMVQGGGCNYYGQISTGCVTNVVAIAAGANHSLFLLEDQTVVARGGYGGYGTNPVVVPPGLSNVVAISAGFDYSMALRADGTVFSWNEGGPSALPQDWTNIVAISAGTFHSLALRADGTVLGSGTTVPAGLSNIVAISAGRGVSLVLRDDGTVVGWGLATSSADPSTLSNIVAISAGDNSYFEAWEALRSDGIVLYGSTYNNSWYPTGASGVTAISCSKGNDGHISWGLSASGYIDTFGPGYNYCGGPSVPSPAPTNVVAVASGDSHDLALIGDAPPGPIVQKTALLNPKWENNAFSVSVPTQNGRVYRLEYKETLQDSNWIGLPLVPGNGHLQTLSDSATSQSQRFYRVRRW